MQLYKVKEFTFIFHKLSNFLYSQFKPH